LYKNVLMILDQLVYVNMKISLEWLNEYIDLDMSVSEIEEILTNLGFPIEEAENFGEDTVLDVEVTSNRGDCLCYIGIARELAAATGKHLKMPAVTYETLDAETSRFTDVNIAAPELCNRYAARYIEGVKIGPSPQWMSRRLEASGLRSINNIVDSTNYAMLETGQPSHAFDYDKLEEGRIVVRNAVHGEELVSIDETKCELKPDMLVIADAFKPVAIAGVMGGLETEVSDNTTRILLETAQFVPITVRSTGRSLGISSESSFRFERHIDTEGIDWASRRIVHLMTLTGGGKAAKDSVDRYPVKHEQKKVSMRLSRLNSLMGFDFSAMEVRGIFTRLAFNPEYNSDTGVFVCTRPTWRHDISREIDLIEEAARVAGYSRIPLEKRISIDVAKPDPRQAAATKIVEHLNSCGFYEALGITFTDEKTSMHLTGNSAEMHLAVKDATRKTNGLLRQTLLGTLLGIVQYNHNVGNRDCRFFEISDTFELFNQKGSKNPVLEEKTRLAMVADGDFRIVKGALETLIASLDRTAKLEFKETDLRWAQAGAEILLNGSPIGFAGMISEETAKVMSLKDSHPGAVEIDLEPLLPLAASLNQIKRLPKFPAVDRDLSLIVDENVKWAQIESTVVKKAPQELESIEFIDIYRGKPIEKGKKSVTLSMRFRDEDGTLKNETVDGYIETIFAGLKEKTNAVIREQ
jgi:phenylalanyl-tRNA synthetase beta chain